MDISIKAGISFQSPYAHKRAFQIYLMYYNGNLPFGRFYMEDADFIGIGVGFVL